MLLVLVSVCVVFKYKSTYLPKRNKMKNSDFKLAYENKSSEVQKIVWGHKQREEGGRRSVEVRKKLRE